MNERILRHIIIGTLLLLPRSITACEDCESAATDGTKLERSIGRLESIISINEDFMASLDEDDHSERIKARSNVSIARKRISSSETILKEKRLFIETSRCQTCLAEGNNNETK